VRVRRLGSSHWLVRFVRHPATSLFVGIVLVASGLGQTVADIRGGFQDGFRLGPHHGIVVYGLFQILAALANFLQGLEQLEVAETGD